VVCGAVTLNHSTMLQALVATQQQDTRSSNVDGIHQFNQN